MTPYIVPFRKGRRKSNTVFFLLYDLVCLGHKFTHGWITAQRNAIDGLKIASLHTGVGDGLTFLWVILEIENKEDGQSCRYQLTRSLSMKKYIYFTIIILWLSELGHKARNNWPRDGQLWKGRLEFQVKARFWISIMIARGEPLSQDLILRSIIRYRYQASSSQSQGILTSQKRNKIIFGCSTYLVCSVYHITLY